MTKQDYYVYKLIKCSIPKINCELVMKNQRELTQKEIHLTFDKRYIFIIRDKNIGKVWFEGIVYELLLR